MVEIQQRATVRSILTICDENGSLHAITTPAEWDVKREALRAIILKYLGVGPQTPPAPEMRIYEDWHKPAYRHLLVGYEVEPGEEVRAHLLIPPAKKRKNGAALLCLHGTTPSAKDSCVYSDIPDVHPRRDYGHYLAIQGYITISPDHCCSGERQPAGLKPYDTTPFYNRHPQWSMAGKAIWDSMRAIDVLCRVTEVDPERIGVVGHSLGGYGSIFTAAFDERVKAAVSSCGLTIWTDNPKRLEWARDRWYIHFPALRQIFLENQELPFDLHEFASLIAPRAFLNISGLSDTMYAATNEFMGEAGWQIYRVYELLGAGEHFANLLFGGVHEVPNYGRALTAAWFDRWIGGAIEPIR